jgi:hypothetical protein
VARAPPPSICPQICGSTAERSTAAARGKTRRRTGMSGIQRLPRTGGRTPTATGRRCPRTDGPGSAPTRGPGRRIITGDGVSRATDGSGFRTTAGERRGSRGGPHRATSAGVRSASIIGRCSGRAAPGRRLDGSSSRAATSAAAAPFTSTRSRREPCRQLRRSWSRPHLRCHRAVGSGATTAPQASMEIVIALVPVAQAQPLARSRARSRRPRCRHPFPARCREVPWRRCRRGRWRLSRRELWRPCHGARWHRCRRVQRQPTAAPSR